MSSCHCRVQGHLIYLCKNKQQKHANAQNISLDKFNNNNHENFYKK